MVLDSVDDSDIFFDEPLQHEQGLVRNSQPTFMANYLPQSSNGSILVTSRNKDVAAKLTGGHNNIREVCVMDKSEGLELLRFKLQVAPSKESAAELLSALDHIPLAISQAAAYINRRVHMDISCYVTELRANRKKDTLVGWESDDFRRDESASKSVMAAWKMSFDRIRLERPSAADLLSLLSFFNAQSIPGRVLRCCNNISSEVSTQYDAEKSSEEDLALLQAFSFVAVTAGSDTYEMHPLVQHCTRLWLSSFGDMKDCESQFIQLMAQAYPDATYETWEDCQELLPHVERLLEIEVEDETNIILWAQVLRDAVAFMVLQGTYKAAEGAATKLFSVCQKLLGPEHQVTLTSINALAYVMRAQGNYDDAETLWQQAFTGWVKTQGQDHKNTLSAASSLATVLHDLGKLHEAEKLYQQTLALCERTLGLDHDQTLETAVQLALVLHSLGRYEEAEKYHRYALEGKRKKFGIQHPRTLLSMNSLGGVLHAQEKYDEAEAYYRRALEGRKRILREKHPSILTSMNNLASNLSAQAKYAEAEILNRQVLEWREEDDKEHPDTFTSMSNLAQVLEAQGKHQEAEALSQRALQGRERKLGPDHLDTLLSKNNLALLLYGLQRYEEAAPLYQQACDGLEKSLGLEHPWTITCHSDFSAMQLKAQAAQRPPSLYERVKARMQHRNT
jgi:tetratricopeptide (TPR) repeat protein